MAERFLYLPSFGLAGCAVAAARWKLDARLRWAAVGLVCVLLAVRTYARNADWHDDFSLWTSTVAASPEGARPHNNLGIDDLDRGDLDSAAKEFQAALAIRPDDAEAHYNLGKVLARLPGRLPDAIAEYRAALRTPPDYSPLLHATNVHVSLGNALARTPETMPQAIAEYRAALAVNPDSAEAHYNLGNALARSDRVAEAIGEWQAALRTNPELADAHFNLGIVYARDPQRIAAALEELEATMRLRPDPRVAQMIEQLRATAQK